MIWTEVEQPQGLWAGVTGLIRLWKYVEKQTASFRRMNFPLERQPNEWLAIATGAWTRRWATLGKQRDGWDWWETDELVKS